MPELPEVEALAQFLSAHAVGAVVGRVDVAALSVLKTFDPAPAALQGRDVGQFDDETDELVKVAGSGRRLRRRG